MRRALAWLSSKPNKRGNGTKKRLSAGHTTRPIFEFTAAGYLTLAGLGIEGEAADWLAGRGTRGGGFGLWRSLECDWSTAAAVLVAL